MEDKEMQDEMLTEVLDDGEHIELMDGSRRLINPGDMPTVCTWIPTATIRIALVEPDAVFPYELTNLNIDATVRAMKEC